MEIEFFTFEQEVWYRKKDGSTSKLTESSSDIVEYMIEKIEAFYPQAYEALSKEYERCKPNLPYFRYRIVHRFCKCNFGLIDDVADISASGKFNFEYVGCPLRGECRFEGIICRPEFNSKLTPSEMRVLKLLFRGESREDIASALYLSIHTVNNHIHNAFARLNLHSVADFVKWAASNKLFGDEI